MAFMADFSLSTYIPMFFTITVLFIIFFNGIDITVLSTIVIGIKGLLMGQNYILWMIAGVISVSTLKVFIKIHKPNSFTIIWTYYFAFLLIYALSCVAIYTYYGINFYDVINKILIGVMFSFLIFPLIFYLGSKNIMKDNK